MAKVLFVDDELLVINSLKRGLATESYESFFAHSGEDALNMLASHDFHVLVTDMKMPGMNGLELLKRAKELYPNVVRIVLSGYTALPQVLVTINQGEIFKFITKPWDLENEFKQVIREAIQYADFIRAKLKKESSLTRVNTTYQNMLKQYDKKLEFIRMDIDATSNLSKKIHLETMKIIQHSTMASEDKNKVQLLMQLNDFFIALAPILSVKSSGTAVLESLNKVVSSYLDLARVEIVSIQGTTELGICEAKFILVVEALAFIIQQFVENDAYLRVRLIARPQVFKGEKGEEGEEGGVNHLTFLCEFRHVTLKYEKEIGTVIEIINQFISTHHVTVRFAVQSDQLILEFDYTL